MNVMNTKAEKKETRTSMATFRQHCIRKVELWKGFPSSMRLATMEETVSVLTFQVPKDKTKHKIR
jgi:hypothetical protein